MKKCSVLYIIISIIVMFFSVKLMAAGDPVNETILLFKVTDNNDDGHPDSDHDGNRTQVRPIRCTISVDNGIQCDVDFNDIIIIYEIWCEDTDICIASYTDQLQFVQNLFSFPGNYKIRLVTDDCNYIGYISTI